MALPARLPQPPGRRLRAAGPGRCPALGARGWLPGVVLAVGGWAPQRPPPLSRRRLPQQARPTLRVGATRPLTARRTPRPKAPAISHRPGRRGGQQRSFVPQI